MPLLYCFSGAASLHLFNSGLQVNLVFFVVQGEQVKLFGKVVEYNVNVADQKFSFGNVEFIDLRGKANRIAAGAEFVAEVAHARRRNRNLVRRHRIFGGNLEQGVENIAITFSQKFAFLAVHDNAHVLVVLAQAETFVHHQGRITAATVVEACRFEDGLCAELLGE